METERLEYDHASERMPDFQLILDICEKSSINFGLIAVMAPERYFGPLVEQINAKELYKFDSWPISLEQYGILDLFLIIDRYFELCSAVVALRKIRTKIKKDGKILIVSNLVRSSVGKITNDLRRAGFARIRTYNLFSHHIAVLASLRDEGAEIDEE